MKLGHFEIVHTGNRAFHGRFIASNGQTVWWTETYKQRIDAHHAINCLASHFGGRQAMTGVKQCRSTAQPSRRSAARTRVTSVPHAHAGGSRVSGTRAARRRANA